MVNIAILKVYPFKMLYDMNDKTQPALAIFSIKSGRTSSI